MLLPFTPLYGYYLARRRAIISLFVPNPTFLQRPRTRRCSHPPERTSARKAASYSDVFMEFSNILFVSTVRVPLLDLAARLALARDFF